jgi:hypothetical protein
MALGAACSSPSVEPLVTAPSNVSGAPLPPLVPGVRAGTLSYTPEGTGLSGATRYEFAIKDFVSDDGTALTYTWDLGDGYGFTKPETEWGHTYLSPGHYEVSVTARNQAGGSAKVSIPGGIDVVSVTGQWIGNFPSPLSSAPVSITLKQGVQTVTGAGMLGPDRPLTITGSVIAPRRLHLRILVERGNTAAPYDYMTDMDLDTVDPSIRFDGTWFLLAPVGLVPGSLTRQP